MLSLADDRRRLAAATISLNSIHSSAAQKTTPKNQNVQVYVIDQLKGRVRFSLVLMTFSRFKRL